MASQITPLGSWMTPQSFWTTPFVKCMAITLIAAAAITFGALTLKGGVHLKGVTPLISKCTLYGGVSVLVLTMVRLKMEF